MLDHMTLMEGSAKIRYEKVQQLIDGWEWDDSDVDLATAAAKARLAEKAEKQKLALIEANREAALARKAALMAGATPSTSELKHFFPNAPSMWSGVKE